MLQVMTKWSRFGLASVMLAGFSGTAGAAIVTQQFTGIIAATVPNADSGSGGDPSFFTTTLPVSYTSSGTVASTQNGHVASASQTTTASSLAEGGATVSSQLHASFSGPALDGVSPVQGNAQFYWTFSLDSIYQYSIAFTITSLNDPMAGTVEGLPPYFAFSSVLVELLSDNSPDQTFVALGGGIANSSLSGTLSAGDYAILAYAHADSLGASSSASVSSDLQFTLTPAAPVPLPPALWLFGSGLLGLIGVARRRSTI